MLISALNKIQDKSHIIIKNIVFKVLNVIKKVNFYRIKFKRIILPFAIGITLVSVPIILFIFKNTQEAAAWFDDTWYYRTKITINNSGSEDANKKVLIEVNTATLITDGKMQSDCGDSRFTDINGDLLRYYIDAAGGACNTSSTDYYVLIPTIHTVSTVIFHYYGNPNAINGTESVQFSQSTFSPTSTTVATEEKSQSPILYWPFDEGKDITVTDLSGNQNAGSLTSATTPITKVEQQINIINEEFSTTNTSDSPTDNSLGLILWDGTKYNGETVYFEALIKCTTCTGGNTRVAATLYTDSGGAVTGATVTSTSSSYALVRSGAITANMTDDEEYSVRIKVDATSGTAAIKAARLIVLQSDEDITETQTQIELGNAQTISTTSYSELTDPKYYYYDASKFTGTTNAYFEATVKSDTGSSSQGDGRIWSSGFELNSTTDGVEWELALGSPSVQGTTVRSGDFALQSTSFSSGTRKGVISSIISPASNGPFYIRTYFRYATLPTAENTIMFITDKIPLSLPVILAYITIDSSGQLKLYDEDGAIGSVSSALSANTWYRIEMEYNRTASAGSHVIRARIDGTEFAGSNTRNLSVAILGFGIGGNMNLEAQTTGNWFFDDIAVNNSTGGYPGPGKIIHLRPNNTGDADDWTGTYTDIDEVTPNDITDYISSVSLISEYVNIDDTPAGLGSGDTINNVTVGVRARSSDGSANARFKVGIKDPTEGIEENPTQLTNNTTTWYTNKQSAPRTYNLTYYDLPNASTTRWSKSTLDSAQIGVTQTTAVGGVAQAQVSTLWMLVDYTPASESINTALVKLQQCDENSCSWGDITDSTLTSTSTNYTRLRSSALTLTDNRRYRIVVQKAENSGTVKIANAKLIIDQTDSLGIGDIELVHQQINTLATDNDSTYTSQSFLNTYTPANFDPNPTVYFESTIKTSAGTGYSQIYNNTATQVLSGSEITTTSTSYTRVKSTAITMPVSTSQLDVQIKNSATNTTSVSSSWLVINVTGGTSGTLPTWQTPDLCAKGSCLYFNGDSVIRTFSSDDELNPGTSSFSVSAWFRHSSTLTGTDTIITRFSSGGYKIYATSIGLCFGIDNDGTAFPSDYVCSPNTFADSTWHHVTAVKNGTSSISLYVDGVRVGHDTSITSSSISGSSPLIQVGAESVTGSNSWDGFIDDLKIYNYALSEAQVKASFNSPGNKAGSSASFDTNHRILTNGLVGYWRMDEASGVNTLQDSSGNSNDGTATDTNTGNGDSNTPPAATIGRFGNARDFDETDDNVNIGDPSTLQNLPNGAFTASAWFYLDTAAASDSTAIIISKGEESNIKWHLGVENAGGLNRKLVASVEDSANSTNSVEIDVATWYHVVMTYDNNIDRKIKLYLNSSEIPYATQNTMSGNYSGDSSIDLKIGSHSDNTGFFDGKIDEVRIYNRQLSPAEVSSLYNWSAGPMVNFKLDEPISNNKIYDNSGNEVSASLTSVDETSIVPGKFGKGLKLNGTSGYATIDGETDQYSINTFSVMSWVNLTSINSTNAIFSNQDDVNDGWRMVIEGDSTNGIRCDYNSDNVQVSSSITQTGQWYHVACVSDGTILKAYVNGIIVGSSSVSGDINESTAAKIGSRSNSSPSHFFPGTLDDIKLYNYARTTDQIVQDMNAGHPVGGSPVASQTAYFKFDELQGQSIYNTNTAVSLTANRGTTSGEQSQDATWLTNTSCKSNGCLDFDGSDDIVTVTNAPAIDLNDNLSTGVTFSAWIYADTVGEGSAGEIFRKTANTYCRLGGSSPFNLTCSLDLSTDATLTVNSVIPSSRWMHIAMAWTDDSDDEITIWVNGQVVGTSTNGVGPTSAESSDILIGGGSSNNFDGRIDEFKIYNSELTLEQMLIDFNLNSAAAMGSMDVGQNILGGAGNSPIAYLNFDQKTGTSAADISGNALAGTLTNGPVWAQGKFGSGVKFDGSDDVVTINDNALLDFGTGTAFTYSFWVKLNGTGTQNFIHDGQEQSGATDASFIVFYDDATNVLHAAVTADTSSTYCELQGTTDIANTQWHHIEIVVNRAASCTTSDILIYLNGTKETTSVVDNSNNTNIDLNNDDPLSIGGYYVLGAYTNNLNGYLDELKIYNYARNQAQVAWDYNKGAPVAWYKFDECQGTTVYDFAPNANGGFNGNNGTITIGDSGSTYTSAGSCNSGTSSHAWNAGSIGKVNAALGFDGTNDYVNLGDILKFVSSFSISAWYNRADTDEENYIINKTGGAGSRDWSLKDEDGATYIEIATASNVTTRRYCNTGTETNTWYHITGVYNSEAQTLDIYLNGQNCNGILSGGTVPASLFSTSNNVYIGGRQSTNTYFNGLIDDIRVYNYAISPTQIKQIMNNGSIVSFTE